MALSDEVRSELAAIDPVKPCCRLAELSALVRTAGSVHLRGAGRIGVHLDVAGAAVARRAFTLLRGYGVACEIRTFRSRSFERSARFQLHLGDEPRAVQTLNEAGILDARVVPLDRPPRRVVSRSCCRAAYLRGAFLAGGSVTGPRHAHLELRTETMAGAELLADLAARDDLRLTTRERRGYAIAYAKGLETIADVLAALGAHDAAIRLGELAVLGSIRSRANRLANADHANLVRSSRAADEQVRAIERLRADGHLDHLSPDLREMAELRLRNRSLSLRELAARCSPPATKASVQRRLERLRRLAER